MSAEKKQGGMPGAGRREDAPIASTKMRGRPGAAGIGMRSGAKPGTFKRLIKYLLKENRGKLIVVFLCIVLGSIASVVSVMFMQRLIDEAVIPGMKNGMAAVAPTLTKLFIMMGVFFAIGVTATFIHTRTMAGITQGTLCRFRDDMFKKMETLPIVYFDRHKTGDVMSNYTNDTDAIRQLIGQSLPNLIQSSLTILSVFVMMIYYSVPLTLVVIAELFVMFRIVKKIGGRSARYMTAQQASLAKEEGFVEEMIRGQKVVKVFNHEPAAIEDFNALNEQLFSDSENANKSGNVLMPVLANVGNLIYVLLAFVGAFMVFLQATNFGLRGAEAVTIGVVVSFLSLSRQLSQTVGQVSMQAAMIAMGTAGAGRVFALIDETPEADGGYVTLVNAKEKEDGSIAESEEKTGKWAWKHTHQESGETEYRALTGDILLDMVDFGYVPEKLVLEDISIFAKPGQKIALVGATGAGKTTITNLLNRFYDIPDGKIRYDGINVTKIRKPDLRHAIGMVLQDVNLFTGTVMDNIRYGRLDATDEECVAAAKLANADSFIRRLPDGYDTMLTGNGASLSQGQRQLLSIARAAVCDPPVMILDEATSSIDTRTEALVQRGMDNLMKGRTVFVIAHRLSTVRNADCIIVLDHGRIIERGTHDQLLEQKGTYYHLYPGKAG